MRARRNVRSQDSARRLCVMTGAHRGASCTLGDGAMAVIGQRDDCDVILSDDGIAAHHCIVSNVGNQPMVRAVDGSATLGSGTLEPGEPRPLPDFEPLSLSDTVTVLVGPAEDERGLF